jgi:hypothetical protein
MCFTPIRRTKGHCLGTLSKSKLLYDWWSVSQYVLVSSILVGLVSRYYFLLECCCLKFAVLFLWGALSDKRMGLQFAVWSQWSESRRTHNHTLLSHLRLPQPGGPGSCIYIPQEQGGPVIPLGTAFRNPLNRRYCFLDPTPIVVCPTATHNFLSPLPQKAGRWCSRDSG